MFTPDEYDRSINAVNTHDEFIIPHLNAIAVVEFVARMHTQCD